MVVKWLADKIAEMVFIMLTGQPFSECQYKRRCGPDNCQCWADEQKKRRADLDKEQRRQ